MTSSNVSALPPGLAETEISIFANARATDPQSVKLGAVLTAIQDGRRADKITKLRALLARGDRDAYDAQKKKLSGVTLSGSFSVRNAQSLLKHSGLLQVDIDHLPNPEEVRDQLAADPYICAAFLSPSAQGVKAILRIPFDPARHKESFLVADRYLKENYGLENDKTCSDVCRLCFVSHDPDLRLNPDAVPLPLPEPRAGQGNLEFDASKVSPQAFDLGKIPSPEGRDFPAQTEGETAERLRSALQSLSAEDYEPWIRMGHALKGWNGPGAFDLWHSWSAGASTYKDPADCRNRWQGFRPDSGIDEGAVFRAATDAGWSLPRREPASHPIGVEDGAGVSAAPQPAWPEPKPLPPLPAPPPQLSPDILPEPLAEYARVTALENEASPEAVTVFLLAAIGAVTGTRFCIRPDYRKKTFHEFPVRSAGLVMGVSENKSGVFKAGIGPIANLQRKYRKEDQKILAESEDDQAIFKKKKSGLLKKLEKLQEKGEAEEVKKVEEQIRSLKEPKKKFRKVVTLTGGSREKILEILSQGNERGLLVKRDELAGWFADLIRDGRDGDREWFIEAMTVAKDYDNNTISRGTDEVDNFALSVAGTIQKSKARRLLFEMEKKFKDDGLLQRFMWVCPRPASYKEFDVAHANGFQGMSARLFAQTQELFEGLDALTPADVGAEDAEYAPAPWVGFDEQAQNEFFTWRANLKDHVLTAENMTDGLVSHLLKSERLVSGLALSFHAIKCANADGIKGVPPAVDSDSFNRAVDVWDILRQHAEVFYNLEHINDIEAAHLLNSRLRKLEPAFSASDVKQRKWRGLRDDKLIDEALDRLVSADRILEVEPPRLKRGRPLSRRFFVNPKALKNQNAPESGS